MPRSTTQQRKRWTGDAHSTTDLESKTPRAKADRRDLARSIHLHEIPAKADLR